ncbi:FAD-dependent monooxygenase [Paraburkholderia sp. RL17-373-BIF-A]|uniref:FAD-dependent monooxygenase n=1 Tax=Paraburkholderia sp. RL17-373-BIF-A TaxID=3031629 RepID=UPI0038BCF865
MNDFIMLSDMITEFDAVVVGGGPVGLWVACELALAQLKVAVLERRTERVTQSRALTIHGRTLEVFALRGIVDRFLSLGRRVPNFHFGALGTRIDFSTLDTRYPFALFLPQATTEGLLEDYALELGVDIRRGHLVGTVESHVDRVVIGGETDATPFRVFARYVVGADGARSIVRRAAQIDFVGYPARQTMMLADVVLDAPPEHPVATIVNEAGGLVLAPRGYGDHYRIGLVDASMPHVDPGEPVSLAELASSAARIAGTDFRPRDPIWLSRFTDETRIAEQYRKGRILLAGDAAHIHAPMGGQGMNVGIQDAMNLGWKLASVLRGTAPEKLLDTYERERLPVGKALRDDTLAQLALFSRFDPPMLALRRLLENVLLVPEVNRQFAEQLSGFGVAYPEPLFQADNSWEHQKGVSGQRLRDMDLTLENGSRTTLYRLLEEGRWVRLQLAPNPESVPDASGINFVSLATGTNDPLIDNFPSVLVRPDGYLAHVRRVDGASNGENAGR